MDRTIVVDHLVKNFEVNEKKPGLLGSFESLFSPQKKTVNALKDISFTINQGELVGFIGPNGAGKTTTLKTLSGILYPSSGLVNVEGFIPWERKNKFLKNIALVMGQKNQLWWDLPAIETFDLNRAIYEIPPKKYKRNLDELVTLLGMSEFLKTPVRRLSLGQRMRMELIAALIHEPQIVFLDEPTIGLDVIAQKKIREFLVSYNKRHNATILLTSHNMDDVTQIAKRVIVINEGLIVFDGLLGELIKNFAKEKTLKIFFSEKIDIKKIEKFGQVKSDKFPEVVLTVPRNAITRVASLLLQEFPIVDLTIEEEEIDEIIRQVFKGNLGMGNKTSR